MIRALVPVEGAIPFLGELPATVSVDVWDGAGHPPGGGRHVSLWAPLPSFGGAYYEGTGTWPDALRALPDLEVLQLLTSGYDNVVPHVRSGITVCNAHGLHENAVAEWVVGLLLAVLRHVPEHEQARRQHEAYRPPSEDLAGKRVLIYGYGAIGKVLEARLAPFGVETLRVGRQAREGVHDPATIEPFLETADVLVLLVPLNPATRGLVNAEFLAKLRDRCIVMNASRGPVVDLPALLAELRSGRLRAVLDVTDPEPLPQSHSAFETPNLVLTSRSAGRTEGVWSRVFPFVGQQLRRLDAGEDLQNVVWTSN